MKPTIQCRVSDKGEHSFYLETNEEKYFLFCQKYRKGVGEYFRGGVVLNNALNFSKSNYDEAIIRTMQKIPMYIKYIEKEYDIVVLEKTRKKKEGNKYKRKATTPYNFFKFYDNELLATV